jgi:hypothetical protein
MRGHDLRYRFRELPLFANPADCASPLDAVSMYNRKAGRCQPSAARAAPQCPESGPAVAQWRPAAGLRACGPFPLRPNLPLATAIRFPTIPPLLPIPLLPIPPVANSPCCQFPCCQFPRCQFPRCQPLPTSALYDSLGRCPAHVFPNRSPLRFSPSIRRPHDARSTCVRSSPVARLARSRTGCGGARSRFPHAAWAAA